MDYQEIAMDLQFTPQEEAFRAEVQTFLKEKLPKHISLKIKAGQRLSKADQDEWHAILNERGWYANHWPQEHGGPGWGAVEKFIFDTECALAGGPRIVPFGVNMLGPVLIKYGSEQQKKYWLPRILSGQDWWCQGYSEPGAGSDLAGIRTRARRDADTGEWVIHGQKVWTSWAHESEWVFVLARTDEAAAAEVSARHAGMVLLLVPIRQPGVEVRPIRQITGTSEFNEVFFDGARTEGTLHLGPVGDGWKVAMYLLGCERGASTLGQQAHFRHELDLIIALSKRNGAARDPLIRQRLAKADMGLQTLRAHALRSSDESTPLRVASVSKYAWSNWHRDLGELAMDVLGEQGELVLKEPAHAALQQLWLVSRADTIYAGTNEIQMNLMAERALGMPR